MQRLYRVSFIFFVIRCLLPQEYDVRPNSFTALEIMARHTECFLACMLMEVLGLAMMLLFKPARKVGLQIRSRGFLCAFLLVPPDLLNRLRTSWTVLLGYLVSLMMIAAPCPAHKPVLQSRLCDTAPFLFSIFRAKLRYCPSLVTQNHLLTYCRNIFLTPGVILVMLFYVRLFGDYPVVQNSGLLHY